MMNRVMEAVQKKIVLIVGVGMSPAVLTETVWALAIRQPAVVPDEIVAITTSTGAERLQAEILSGDGQSVWQKMCAALVKRGVKIDGKLRFGSRSSIQVISDGSRDLDDIDSTEGNTIAADFILRTIRSYSENPSYQIYTSIAGGRKTMSALMLSCMSLLARADDHVLHVLVNAPFETRMEPMFYYPDEIEHKDTKGVLHFSEEARIELIDLPFVKVRGLYEERFKAQMPSYAELVHDAQLGAARARAYPHVVIDFKAGRLRVDEEEVPVSEQELVTLGLLLGERPTDFKLLAQRLYELHRHEPKAMDSWLYRFTDGMRFTDEGLSLDNLRKVLSSLRRKLMANASLAPFVSDLVPSRKCDVRYPCARTSVDLQDLLSQFGA